jgi:hypothetical protein
VHFSGFGIMYQKNLATLLTTIIIVFADWLFLNERKTLIPASKLRKP